MSLGLDLCECGRPGSVVVISFEADFHSGRIVAGEEAIR